ncbi:hypothetical protein ABK040_000491 [Willaertia magna]
MKIKTPTKKQKKLTSSHASASEERSKSEEEEENIKVFIVTKPFEDDSDDDNNWKKVQFQLIPSKSTPTKEHYVCYIEDFDKEEISKVKVGILTENKFKDKYFTAYYFMDDKPMSYIHKDGPVEGFEISEGLDYFSTLVNCVTKEEYPLILQKNTIAEDIDEVCEHNVLEQIGKIKVIIKTGKTNNTAKNKNLNNIGENLNNKKTPKIFENIKIKESQSKYKSLSVNLGSSKQIVGEYFSGYVFNEQVFKEFEFEYYTKLGYLFKLRQYGINIENILPYQQPQISLNNSSTSLNNNSLNNNNEPEIIIIDDDDYEDGLDKIVKEKLNKISKKDFLVWNYNKISLWIDELDSEFMENNIGNIMKEQKIGGTTFLELTVDDMKKELNISAFGIRSKLLKVIQYLKKL